MCMAGMAIDFQLFHCPTLHKGGSGKSGIGRLDTVSAQRLCPRTRRARGDSKKRSSEPPSATTAGVEKRGAHSARAGNLRVILGRGPTAQLSLKGDSASRWHGFRAEQPMSGSLAERRDISAFLPCNLRSMICRLQIPGHTSAENGPLESSSC